jgi:hypothetical protein
MTTALLAAETLLLLLLLVLVAGLLRSHAEILRRLGPAGQLAPPPPQEPRSPSAGPAPPVTGTTPSGDAVSLSFEGKALRPTLLAFLTSGCTTCSTFWEALGQHQPPDAAQAIVITHGVDREQPGRLRGLQPDDVPVVMSSQAWEDYGVPGAPYFVLVDGGVRGEGMATSWDALRSLIADAIEDQRAAAGFTGGGGESRDRQVDERLAAAGIGADHPSLYPGGRS